MNKEKLAIPTVEEMDKLVGLTTRQGSGNKSYLDDEFTGLDGPTYEDMTAIEGGELPTDIPQFPTSAVVHMCTELVPEPVHHEGVDYQDTRSLGGVIWEA